MRHTAEHFRATFLPYQISAWRIWLQGTQVRSMCVGDRGVSLFLRVNMYMYVPRLSCTWRIFQQSTVSMIRINSKCVNSTRLCLRYALLHENFAFQILKTHELQMQDHTNFICMWLRSFVLSSLCNDWNFWMDSCLYTHLWGCVTQHGTGLVCACMAMGCLFL